MSRIFVTGDTHGDIDIHKLNTDNFPIQKELDKEDYVIIAGDFGSVWYGTRDVSQTNPAYEIPPQHRSCVGKDDYRLKWYENKSFTTLFIDGNHENHALLDTFPTEGWHGGKVHRIKPSVLHLMRGQVFELGRKTFFTMGGASSSDKMFRTENVSWWERELPSEAEYEEALCNLKRHDFKVDYVITHCIGDMLLGGLIRGYKKRDALTSFLEELEGRLEYGKWFFGHYHEDLALDEKHRVLYQDVIEIT